MAAVTNRQLIALAMFEHGITEPCHTYAAWKESGYQVKKGSKCLFQCTIWKHTEKKDKDGNVLYSKMFPKLSSFFGASQVEPIATI